MKQETETTAAKAAKIGGACALAGCVKVVCAANALLTACVFALAVAWGLALPAIGCAAAFAVCVKMVTAFNAEETHGRRAEA